MEVAASLWGLKMKLKWRFRDFEATIMENWCLDEKFKFILHIFVHNFYMVSCHLILWAMPMNFWASLRVTSQNFGMWKRNKIETMYVWIDWNFTRN
jgi:hypothetical protein